jgi:hypothetical protein
MNTETKKGDQLQLYRVQTPKDEQQSHSRSELRSQMPLEFVVSKKSKVSVLQSIGIREFQSSEKYHRRSKTTNYSGKKKGMNNHISQSNSESNSISEFIFFLELSSVQVITENKRGLR